MIRFTRAQVLPIGVDIGHDSVRMLQVEAIGSTLEVTAAARMPLPPEAKADPARRLPCAADLVRHMLRAHPFRGRRIVAALPRDLVTTKNLRLPPIPAAEVAAVVKFEARNVFPFDVANARVHHLAAGEVRQGTELRQEVIVMAARNDDVNAVVEHLHRSGATLESLDVEPCALYRSVERFIRRKEDENDVHVLVDVGARRSQVVIGRGHDISFIKPIDIGGFHFHDAVSRKLGISVDEAEALRRRLVEAGEPADAAAARRDPVRQAVFDAARAPMEELGREISLCLRYYSVTFRGQRPTKLRLVGGEACDPQLQALLNACLVIPVEVARPLFSVGTSRMKPAERQGTLCEWALALGLCLRTTREHFGPRDGKPREAAVFLPAAASAPATPAPTAEVVDLATALRQADAAALEHEAVTAANAVAATANLLVQTIATVAPAPTTPPPAPTPAPTTPAASLLTALANPRSEPAGETASAGGSASPPTPKSSRKGNRKEHPRA
jgi:type IV pilus assembly protein PilM